MEQSREFRDTFKDFPLRSPPCKCKAILVLMCSEDDEDREHHPKTCWKCRGLGFLVPDFEETAIVMHFRDDCPYPLITCWDEDGHSRMWFEAEHIKEAHGLQDMGS